MLFLYELELSKRRRERCTTRLRRSSWGGYTWQVSTRKLFSFRRPPYRTCPPGPAMEFVDAPLTSTPICPLSGPHTISNIDRYWVLMNIIDHVRVILKDCSIYWWYQHDSFPVNNIDVVSVLLILCVASIMLCGSINNADVNIIELLVAAGFSQILMSTCWWIVCRTLYRGNLVSTIELWQSCYMAI